MMPNMTSWKNMSNKIHIIRQDSRHTFCKSLLANKPNATICRHLCHVNIIFTPATQM